MAFSLARFLKNDDSV